MDTIRRWPTLLLPFVALAATAQNSAKPGTDTVTGHIYCADTNAPARTAQVQLESVKDAEQRSKAYSHSSGDSPTGGIVQTALDGSFVIPKVPPGSYYVVATAAGYLSPRADAKDIDNAEPPPPAGQPPLVLPRVDVQADQAVAIDIRLERGAAVSGVIRFDDGSPASGMHVGIVRRSKDKKSGTNSADIGIQGNEITDDLGRYRIGGLRDGEYIVDTALVHLDLVPGAARGDGLSSLMRSSLMIYSGDATRKSDAVPFKLGVGEERTGEDITIPLSKLHSIGGVVTAARDGHAINGGNLNLTTSDGNETIGIAEIANDGSFHLESVPEGTYTLRIHNARDTRAQILTLPGNAYSSEKTVHQYGDLEQSLKVEGDIPNLVLAVPEQTKQHASQ
ncbi:MAG: carboxypeptidase-like regulatory domain-containing protein [Acidobacteriota bacterium]